MNAFVAAIPRMRDDGWEFQGLIVTPLLEGDAPVDYPEPDLFDYGAERILVVDDPIVVDLLVRNGVHTDSRAIIISLSGYPRQVRERAASLVRNRPDVSLHLLHGSSVNVEAMSATTRALLGASDATPIDIGISPSTARKVAAIRWARRLASVPVDALPYGWLTSGVSEALTTGTSLEALSEREDGAVGHVIPELWWSRDRDNDFG
jgi:hypothetical protein